MKTKQNRVTEYNRRVLRHLESISPDHATALNSRGTALGWWHIVAHLYNCGTSAESTSRQIAQLTIA